MENTLAYFVSASLTPKNAYEMRLVFPLEQLIKCIEIFNESSRMTDFKMHSRLGPINTFTLVIYGCNLRGTTLQTSGYYIYTCNVHLLFKVRHYKPAVYIFTLVIYTCNLRLQAGG